MEVIKEEMSTHMMTVLPQLITKVIAVYLLLLISVH